MGKKSLVMLVLSLVVIFSIVLAFGCGQGSGGGSGGGGDTIEIFDNTLPDGVISFEVSPVSAESYLYIVPLGNLNPSEHTLPTDHVYFTHNDTSETIPVYAPTAGKILDIHTFTYASGYDNRLIIGVKKTYSYYLIHLVANASLKKGDTVVVGQQLGVASGKAAAVDLGILSKNEPQPFINTDHYVNTNIYSNAPLKYYLEPLKSQLYATVRRLGTDKDGQFCYDQAGKLIGGWFVEGTTSSEISAGTAVGTKEIAFVHDNYDPTQIAISVGGTVLTKGVYYVQNGAADPTNVTSASGKITYKLYSATAEASRTGLMIVQMLADGRTKVEASSTTTTDEADFTAAASYYTR